VFVHTRISSAGTRLRLECRCGEIKGDGALDVASLGKQVERRCSSEVIATVNEYAGVSGLAQRSATDNHKIERIWQISTALLGVESQEKQTVR